VKYAFIETQRESFAITKMCRWLEVSRSGYYKWRLRAPSDRAKQRMLVVQAVMTTFEQFKHRYGAPRLEIELNALGIRCSRNHVAQILAENGLKARNGKGYKFFPGPNAINHVSDNLLARDFTAKAPNEKWVSDITYIKVDRGHVYLAVVMDLFSRKIVGWSLDSTLTNKIIVDAFEMAVANRGIKPGLILHSDRGVQYRSGEYQHRLHEVGIRPSMSRKGNCWDNAAMESFFARLKVESIYADDINTKQEAFANVFGYIELFYNSVRRHSTNGYKSPNNYEKEYYDKCA